MSKFFIFRPVFSIVIALVILIAGALCIAILPIAQYPDITPPTIQVSCNYPGADAQTVAESIAIPLEQQINGAEDMMYMSSTSTSDGRYSLVCTFSVDKDPDMANVDINNRVSKATSKLPQDVIDQGITITKQSSNLLMVLVVYSPNQEYDPIFLSNYASIQMIDEITRTNGVGSTTVVGQRDYSMRVWLNPEKLAKLGVTANDIVNVVNEQNILAPAGSVGQPPALPGTDFEYIINVKGRLDSVEEFNNIIVRTQQDGSFLRMKDVATVELAAQSYTSIGKQKDIPATIILVYQQTGANAITTVKTLRKTLEKMVEEMPTGVTCDIALDTTEFINQSIKEVIETLRDAIILVLIVVLIFLGSFRATLIPMLAVPVSLVGTFAAFKVLNFSINTLTLFGIVLAVGLVVDDAIVVVEAVESYLEKGFSPDDSTVKAMEDVQSPVIAIALVLCAVFVPVAFMGGITGLLYKQFALTLAFSVVLSAIVALTLTPALCRMILRPKAETRGLFGRFFAGFNKVFDWVTHLYTIIVRFILKHPVIFLLILGAIWFGAYHLVTTTPTGFVPNEDMGYFYISMTLPDGASMQRTEQLTTRAADFIKNVPGVDNTVILIGLNIFNSTFASNNCTIICQLKPWDERKTKETGLKHIIHAIQAELDTYPEAVCLAMPPPPIPGLGNAGGFQFELQDKSAHTLEELSQTADEFMAELKKNPEIGSLFCGYRVTVPQFNLKIDRDKAKNMGISLDTIFSSLQIFLGGYPVNDFNLYDRTFKVMVQALPEYRSGSESIGKIQVRGANNEMIPLSALVEISDGAGPSLIQRYNMYKTAEITGSAAPGASSGEALDIVEKVAKEKLPQGYGYEWSGTAFEEKQSQGTQAIIFALALIFVFLFLAAQYESWSIPFSILLGMPIGVFGAFLLITRIGLDDNVYTQIGLVMLIGLAAKNAILIVEYAKERYENQGMTLIEATVEGSKVRLRPILMTSFAFILGVLPLLKASGAGAAARVSLGAAVFGGMLAATSLGVFFIPLLYVIIEKLSEAVFKKPEKKREKKEAVDSGTKEKPAENGGENEDF